MMESDLNVKTDCKTKYFVQLFISFYEYNLSRKYCV